MKQNYWSKRERNPMRRRKFLSTAAVSGAGLAGLSLVGCGDDDDTHPSSTPGQPSASSDQSKTAPTPGGTLQLVTLDEVAVWDHDATVAAVGILWDAVAETILTMKKDSNQMEAGLASAWEQPDPLTVVLKMPPTAKFDERPPTNGRSATAEDVKASIEHGATNRPEFLKRDRYKVIDKMEAGPAELVIKLKEPNAPLITYLGHQYVLAKETFPTDLIIRNPTDIRGTGPFYVNSYQPSVGGNTVKKRNYWRNPALPYMDGVNWTNLRDRAALIAAYRAGDVDWGYSTTGGVTGGEKEQLSSNSKLTFESVPNRYVHWLVFLHDDQKIPFKDGRLRTALHLALNRQEELQLDAQGSGTICGPLSPDLFPTFAIPQKELLVMPGYRPDKSQDLAEAKKLLSAAGFPDGLTIPMDIRVPENDLNSTPGIIAVSQFAKIGVKLDIINKFDQTTYKANEDSRKFNFHPSGISAAPEIDDQFTTRYLSTGARNVGNYANSQVDDLIAKQRRALNNSDRIQYALDLQKLLINDVSHLHMFTLNANSVKQPRVMDIYGTPVKYQSNLDKVWLKKG